MTLKEARRISAALPRKKIPIVTLLSLAITAVPFLTIAVLLTLLIPKPKFVGTDPFSSLVAAAILSGFICVFIYGPVKSVVERNYKVKEKDKS